MTAEQKAAEWAELEDMKDLRVVRQVPKSSSTSADSGASGRQPPYPPVGSAMETLHLDERSSHATIDSRKSPDFRGRRTPYHPVGSATEPPRRDESSSRGTNEGATDKGESWGKKYSFGRKNRQLAIGNLDSERSRSADEPPADKRASELFLPKG